MSLLHNILRFDNILVYNNWKAIPAPYKPYSSGDNFMPDLLYRLRKLDAAIQVSLVGAGSMGKGMLTRRVAGSALPPLTTSWNGLPRAHDSEIDPAAHSRFYGGFEGRDAGPRFLCREPLAQYPEAGRKRINPLLDYIRHKNFDQRSK